MAAVLLLLASTCQLQKQVSSKMIVYQVKISDPSSHLFEVTLELENWQKDTLDLKFPVWTPGSYLVREYSKHLQNFQAHTNKGEKLPFVKITKNHWQIQTLKQPKIIISYQIYANELSVRTNHLDDSHGYFNGAALFFLIVGLESEPITLKIILPQDNWHVSTTLAPLAGHKNIFIARDFDTLVDSPVEIGTQKVYDFQVLDKPHQLVIWGKGNLKIEQFLLDISKIIETQAQLFDGLPYQQYMFLLHLCANGYGGLEHRDCCSLLYSRNNLSNPEKYENLIQLVAHEFFHLWNVKRIRPKALEKFNYESENYTTSLWFSEGATSYYDILIPCWSKIYSSEICLQKLAKDINRYLNTPGRMVQSVRESSFDAWIKLYRRDANSDNSQISYYLKGEMICLVLDLLIRNRHQNKKSLNDVLKRLWREFGQTEVGFSEDQLQQIIEQVSGQDLSKFFELYLDGITEIPFNEYLEPFGLLLKPQKMENYLGIKLENQLGRSVVKFVEIGSPAQLSGINPEDELLAIDGIKVTAEQLSERLKEYQGDDMIEITLFHQDELRTLGVQLGQPRPSGYELVEIQSPSQGQKQNLQGWIY